MQENKKHYICFCKEGIIRKVKEYEGSATDGAMECDVVQKEAGLPYDIKFLPYCCKEPRIGYKFDEEIKACSNKPTIEQAEFSKNKIDDTFRVLIASYLTIKSLRQSPINVPYDDLVDAFEIVIAFIMQARKMSEKYLEDKQEVTDSVNDLFAKLGLKTKED